TDTEVDVGAQRVQRNTTLAVPLGAAHLGATEAARGLHADAECAGLLGVLHGALHGPSEGDAVDQLIGDTLSDEGGDKFWALALDDVELHLRVAGEVGQQAAELVGLRTTTTDDDAGTCSVDVDAHLVTRALDLDATDRRALELGHQRSTDLPILGEIVLVLALGEPAALPIGRDPKPESVRVDLLAHFSCPPSLPRARRPLRFLLAPLAARRWRFPRHLQLHPRLRRRVGWGEAGSPRLRRFPG